MGDGVGESGYTWRDWPGAEKKQPKSKKDKKDGWLKQLIDSIDLTKLQGDTPENAKIVRLMREYEVNEGGQGNPGGEGLSSKSTVFNRDTLSTESEDAAAGKVRTYESEADFYENDGSVRKGTFEGEPNGLVVNSLSSKSPQAETVQKSIEQLAKTYGVETGENFSDGYWGKGTRETMFKVLEEARKKGDLKKYSPTGKLDRNGLRALTEVMRANGYMGSDEIMKNTVNAWHDAQ